MRNNLKHAVTTQNDGRGACRTSKFTEGPPAARACSPEMRMPLVFARRRKTACKDGTQQNLRSCFFVVVHCMAEGCTEEHRNSELRACSIATHPLMLRTYYGGAAPLRSEKKHNGWHHPSLSANRALFAAAQPAGAGLGSPRAPEAVQRSRWPQ